jgi:cation-transporting ATPase 13A3/4/5
LVLKEGKDVNVKSLLFAGTRVIQAVSDGHCEEVEAVVIQTGIRTAKGAVLRNILFPTPLKFIFLEQLKIVVPILLFTGFVYFLLTVLFIGLETSSWFYGVFSVSYVLNPLLPAVLTIGQSVASKRLEQKGIVCVDASRISVAGKIKTFCFDKTGTLTKEGLEFHSFTETVVVNGEMELQSEESVAHYPEIVRLGMATCHELSMVSIQL